VQQLGIILFLVGGATASVLTKKLTTGAAILGAAIGYLLFLGIGWVGILLMATFFLLGTLATSWKRKGKEQIGIAEANKGRREWSQVFANAGVAGVLALLAYFFPQKNPLYSVMIAAVFSSATADTLSSELGSVYGKKFYNILSFKKDKRGLDGVISLEGTLIGIVGSIVIALLFFAYYEWNGKHFMIIVVAGTIGNLFDSFLGAAMERKGLIKNDAVNFLNTLIAALVAWLMYAL
jgi:uncharacterized protein (TIGR00297 family)